jgi:hypothetical protein
MTRRICGSNGETRHFSFYAFGSEGVEMCESCQIATSHFIKSLAEACTRTKFNVLRKMKKEGK